MTKHNSVRLVAAELDTNPQRLLWQYGLFEESTLARVGRMSIPIEFLILEQLVISQS